MPGMAHCLKIPVISEKIELLQYVTFGWTTCPVSGKEEDALPAGTEMRAITLYWVIFDPLLFSFILCLLPTSGTFFYG